ncbi:MAG: hypothetical protein ACK4PI_12120 [Tepidisphaerales bacterium]
MKLTSRQTMLVVVLVGGLTLLAADRLLLGPDDGATPAAARAAGSGVVEPGRPDPRRLPPGPIAPLPGSAPTGSVPTGSATTGSAPPGSAAAPPPRDGAAEPAVLPAATRGWGAPGVQARLRSLQQRLPASAHRRDPFHFERAQVAAVEPPPDTTESCPRRLAAEAFATRHRLRAIVGSGSGGMVLVSDRMVRLGEGVEGWELVHIARDSATFERDGYRVTLPLSDGPTRPGQSAP